MSGTHDLKKAAVLLGALLVLGLAPLGDARFDLAVSESLRMGQEYARQHILLGLLPALVLAGAISTFINQPSLLRYLGAKTNKVVAYGAASLGGAVLSVCSCSVLPLFAGICRMGAGIGPAAAFLYAAPAINVLAIIFTARVLGWPLGLARAVAAVVFGVVIGLVMNAIWGRKGQAQAADGASASSSLAEVEAAGGSASIDGGLAAARAGGGLVQAGGILAALVAITVFLSWTPSGFQGLLRCCPDGATTSQFEGQIVARTGDTIIIRDASGKEASVSAELVSGLRPTSPINQGIYESRFILAGLAAVVLATLLLAWRRVGQVGQWAQATWLLALQILPLLLIGVLASGFLLGRPGRGGLIPPEWIAAAVGGNSPGATFVASLAGSLMYFATLTEVPIVQGLTSAGMGNGPALAMLLAGPTVSLPSLMVLVSLMGVRKTAVYVSLVVALATVSGIVFGAIWPG